MIRFDFVSLEQPIGRLYLGTLTAGEILLIAESKVRTPYNSRGIQRRLDSKRAKQIARYAQSEDAIFPTPIVLSASSEMVEFNIKDSYFMIDENFPNTCSIVDGQHRLEGIKEANLNDEFVLPVVFIFDTFLEQDAEIFAAINGNQKPVSKSLVYDLYGLSDKRTVQKTCHSVIESLNSDEESALKGKIKMLGIKDENNPFASVSQATMIDSLIKFITNNPEKDNSDIEKDISLVKLDEKRFIFRKWFIENEDHMILKVTRSYFNGFSKALDDVYSSGFDITSYFVKSIGYMAGFYLLRPIYSQGIEKHRTAKASYYYEVLTKIFSKFRMEYSKEVYSSSESGAKKLYRDLLIISIKNDYIDKEYIPQTDLDYLGESGLT